MLKNYTSQSPVANSVRHIEDCLVLHGARNIMKEYDDKKRLCGICFIMSIDGREVPFKLPARIKEAEIVLRAKVKRPTATTDQRIREQAERTAWRLMADWVDLHMTLLTLKQGEFMEFFMAYIYSPATKQTLFERAKESKFKLLGM